MGVHNDMPAINDSYCTVYSDVWPHASHLAVTKIPTAPCTVTVHARRMGHNGLHAGSMAVPLIQDQPPGHDNSLGVELRQYQLNIPTPE